jgi:hypothetical protein
MWKEEIEEGRKKYFMALQNYDLLRLHDCILARFCSSVVCAQLTIHYLHVVK